MMGKNNVKEQLATLSRNNTVLEIGRLKSG